MKKYRLFIFDLDGVIFDTKSNLLSTFIWDNWPIFYVY